MTLNGLKFKIFLHLPSARITGVLYHTYPTSTLHFLYRISKSSHTPAQILEKEKHNMYFSD